MNLKGISNFVSNLKKDIFGIPDKTQFLLGRKIVGLWEKEKKISSNSGRR